MRQPTALREKDDPLNEPLSEEDVERTRPRWSYTPEALKRTHDFSLNRVRDPRRTIWHVNEDPAKLDEFYDRFLGRNGSKMLPEELKWLAVTHKSFDYGRRGFNTKLAYFGRLVPDGARGGGRRCGACVEGGCTWLTVRLTHYRTANIGP